MIQFQGKFALASIDAALMLTALPAYAGKTLDGR